MSAAARQADKAFISGALVPIGGDAPIPARSEMNSVLVSLSEAMRSIKVRVTLSAVAALALGIGATTLVLVHEAERDTLAAQTDRELREVQPTAAILSQRVMERQRALADTAAAFDEVVVIGTNKPL